jgi:phage recombination protein Bet
MGNDLAILNDSEFWNDKQLAALRQLGVDRASNADLAVFHHVSQRTGLDPFARQIYMILRDGKQTIQTGIDGFRLVAERSARRDKISYSIGDPAWCNAAGQWSDVWLEDGYPSAAKVTVYKDGQPFPGVALWREYVQLKRDGGITRMWQTRPAGQLAKCAEALALRKAFPQDLAGVYVTDEMGAGDTVQSHVVREQSAVTSSEILGEPVDAEIVEDPPTHVAAADDHGHGEAESGNELPTPRESAPASPQPAGEATASASPAGPSTADDEPTWRNRSDSASKAQVKVIQTLAGKLGMDDATKHAYAERLVGHTLAGPDGRSSFNNLTVRQASLVVDALNDDLRQRNP